MLTNTSLCAQSMDVTMTSCGHTHIVDVKIEHIMWEQTLCDVVEEGGYHENIIYNFFQEF